MSTQTSEFLPIWEIEPHFRCPIIGAALSVKKHEQVLKKCGYDTRHLKPYEYHQCVMSNLSSKNKVSLKVDNFLKSKSRKYMAEVRGKSRDEIRALWKAQSESGNVGPLMYAIVSYEHADIELMHEIYGEVHMQSHANMTQIHDIRKQLAAAVDQIENQKRRAEQKKQENRMLVSSGKDYLKKIKALEMENHEMKAALDRQGPESSGAQESGRITKLEKRVREAEEMLWEKDALIRQRDQEKRDLQVELENIKAEKKLAEIQVQALLDGFDVLSENGMNPSADSCPEGVCSCCTGEPCGQAHLCAKRVFMIGGITKMKAHYKDIVEKAGGRFDYHDGYLKSATANLEARVKRSDIVLCPVNCNSHNACLKVKKLCSRYNKQLKILNSSSLSAISSALFDSEQAAVLN